MALKHIVGVAWLLLFLFGLTVADIYFHNPRGSNNRLFAQTATRKNANRLFNSQNNAKGGYNVGEVSPYYTVINDTMDNPEAAQFRMTYFQSSLLTVEMSYQHGCGVDEVRCNIVLQYMCEPEIAQKSGRESGFQHPRDGGDEGTPRYTQPSKFNNETEAQFLARREGNVQNSTANGQHESWDYYDACYQRQRNAGLFTADKAARNSATATRQNPGGDRYGYECQEERDYYPYWHPSPFRDIAILTDDTSKCKFFQQNSFNVKPVGVCVEFWPETKHQRKSSAANTPNLCSARNGTWVTVSSYLEKAPEFKSVNACLEATTNKTTYIWAVPFDAEDFLQAECLVQPPPPQCVYVPATRSNHLGMTKFRPGEFPRFNWTIPEFPSGKRQRCVLRVRYNISSSDYDPWQTDSTSNDGPTNGAGFRQQMNQELNSIRALPLTDKRYKEAFIANVTAGWMTKLAERAPVITNPKIELAPGFPQLQMAVNTAQTGRTFQDRTHVFVIAPRPPEAANAKQIYNLNIRGKRGNIVEAYNAVEYDFIPEILFLSQDDLVHIQWTGTNSQPGTGQGNQFTDRHNLVLIKSNGANMPLVNGSMLDLWKTARVVWTQFNSAESQFYVPVKAPPTTTTTTTTKATPSPTTTIKSTTTSITSSSSPSSGVATPLLSPSRRKRDVAAGVSLLTNDQIALALATGGYYFCLTRNNCSSVVPDQFVLKTANETLNLMQLDPNLNYASPSFTGLLVGFSPAEQQPMTTPTSTLQQKQKCTLLTFMSSRNNDFSNRSQKGKIQVCG